MAEIVRKIRATSEGELRMLTIYEQAYVGYEDMKATPVDSPHHPAKALSKAELNDPRTVLHWQPRNFLAKVVEEPLGYLGHVRPRLNVGRIQEDGTVKDLDPDLDEDKALQAQIFDFYERKIRPRQADLVLWQGQYGRAFAKVTYDPGTYRHKNADDEIVDFKTKPDVHVVAYPRFEGGIERANAWQDSEDPDLVTSAVVYWLERPEDEWEDGVEDQKYAQLLYPDRIEWLKKTGSGWVLDGDRSQSGTGIDYHPWGLVPLASCWNNGKPDVHDGLEAQVTINRDIFDQNVGAETTAFPQRWRKGLIPPGGWNRDPLTGRREAVEPLRSGPHVVWDVPADGEVGQLASDMGIYLHQKYISDLEDLATLTRSVAVAKMKTSLEVSGESKHMDSAQLLLPRLRAKAEGLGACIRDLFYIAFAMAKADPAVARVLGIDEIDKLSIEVEFEIGIDTDDETEAQLDQRDRELRHISLYSYLIRRGFTESEAKKEIKRLEEERDAEEKRMLEMAKAQEKATDPYRSEGMGV